MNEKQRQMIRELAADLKPLVDKIEASPETTQNHYGDYGALLSRLSKGNKQNAAIIVLALGIAGANQEGILNAYNLFV